MDLKEKEEEKKWKACKWFSKKLNPIKPGGSFLPAASSYLNYFWTTCETNLNIYDFLLEIILLKKELKKNIKFSGGNIFLYRGYCQKIGVRIFRNSFSRRNKYVHVWEVVSTKTFNFVKRLRSTFCWPIIIIYRLDFCKLQANK